MRITNSSMLRRLAAACGIGAMAVLTATALHTGMPTGATIDLQAKGNPTGIATASVAPTMQLGQTVGHVAPVTTTLPAQ